MQWALDEWFWKYNNDYPHSTLNHRTPCEFEEDYYRGEKEEKCGKNSTKFYLTNREHYIPYIFSYIFINPNIEAGMKYTSLSFFISSFVIIILLSI